MTKYFIQKRVLNSSQVWVVACLVNRLAHSVYLYHFDFNCSFSWFVHVDFILNVYKDLFSISFQSYHSFFSWELVNTH
jgi:hypothetical protein